MIYFFKTSPFFQLNLFEHIYALAVVGFDVAA